MSSEMLSPQLTKLDVNQITKAVYDPYTSSLAVVPAYIDSTPLEFDASVYYAPYRTMGVVVDWKDLDAQDGMLQFKGSIDGKQFVDVGQPFPLVNASGVQDFGLFEEPYCFIKLEYQPGSNKTGSFNAVYMLRA